MSVIGQQVELIDKDGEILHLSHKLPLAVGDVLRLNGVPSSSVLVTEKKDADGMHFTAKVLFNTVFRNVGAVPTQRKVLKTSAAEKTFYEKIVIGPEVSGNLTRYIIEMDRAHFCEYVEKTFADLIKRENLIQAGDDITIGFSGGVDSTLLLRLLLDPRHRIENTNFRAVTVGTLAGTHKASFIEQFCRANSVESHFIDDDSIQKTFNLRDKAANVIDQVLASEHNQKAIFVVQHIIRPMLEEFRESVGSDKIILGLEREALLTSIMAFYLSGYPTPGLFKKSDGKNHYVFPLMSLFKREESLYLSLKMPEYSEVGRPEHHRSRTFDLHSSEWRGTVMLLVGYLLDAFPGIDVYLENAAGRILRNLVTPIKFEICKNCEGSYTNTSVEDEFCETCRVLSDVGLLRNSAEVAKKMLHA